ncbi:MAG TPA: thermonuclease family protein [Tepidisphaeraceae bacterium]|jgi:micrococcal nuclease
MAFRRPSPAPPPDAGDLVRSVLRRRSLYRRGGVAGVIVVALSAVCSHYTAPPDTAPLAGKDVEVVRVVDGDTLVVRTAEGREERLRLKGIDAPELPHDDKPLMHWGEESTAYLRGRQPGGRRLTLEFDGTEKRDQYGRLLAYAFGEGLDCINVAIVRDGHAYADRRFSGMRRAQIEQAENDARKKGRGLWKSIRTADMPAWRQRWLRDRGISE